MSRINDFLTEAGIFYLATCDKDKPRLRPLGLHFELDGKVIFGVGDFKDVYKQMLANPNVEIVACKRNEHWLRYSGTAVFETDEKYEKYAFKILPGLSAIYNEQTGHRLKMFRLENATARDINLMGEGESLL